MAKVKEEVKEEVKAPVLDFVKLVKEATQGHGLSSFVRVNLNDEVSAEGKNALFNEYSVVGYETFFSADSKSILLLKQ